MNLPSDTLRCTGRLLWAEEEMCEIRERCARFCQTERDSRARPAPFWRGLEYITHCYHDGAPIAYLPEDPGHDAR